MFNDKRTGSHDETDNQLRNYLTIRVWHGDARRCLHLALRATLPRRGPIYNHFAFYPSRVDAIEETIRRLKEQALAKPGLWGPAAWLAGREAQKRVAWKIGKNKLCQMSCCVRWQSGV